MRGLARREMWRRTIVGAVAVLAATVVGVAWAQEGDPLDPAHNVALPCEVLSTPGTVPRSAKNIAHLANVCGFVGTDVEFQSRTANDGVVHHYAFVGTMGAGLRIFDISDPAHPFIAGEYTDPGWENDVQVRGDVAVLTFDPVGVTQRRRRACSRSQRRKAASTSSGSPTTRQPQRSRPRCSTACSRWVVAPTMRRSIRAVTGSPCRRRAVTDGSTSSTWAEHRRSDTASSARARQLCALGHRPSPASSRARTGRRTTSPSRATATRCTSRP